MRTLVQKVNFLASANTLYDLYMNSQLHSDATNSKAECADAEGGTMMAHDGYIHGKFLHLIPGKKIVQTWRCTDWDNSDRDSILILTFEESQGKCFLTMTHEGVPDNQYDNLKKGWTGNYWQLWKEYLSAEKRK